MRDRDFKRGTERESSRGARERKRGKKLHEERESE
jgi:hypothetical protein